MIDTLLYANILIVSASLISKNFDIMLNFFSIIIIIIIIIFNLISDIPKYFYMSFKTWITYQNNSKYGKFLCSASNIILAALRVNP